MTTFLPYFGALLLVCITTTANAGTTCRSLYEDDPGLTSGLYSVDPDGDGGRAPVNVYCDMTDIGQGTASIFVLTGPLQLGPTECSFDSQVGIHDSSILWSDFTTRIAAIGTHQTNGSFWTISRDGIATETTLGLPGRPLGMGDEARPVPFPAMDAVVWLNWQNQSIVWEGTQTSFGNLGIQSNPATRIGGQYNGAVIVSDGVSSLMVSNDDRTGAYILDFDFDTGTVSSRTAQRLWAPEWQTSRWDAFGHVLYTVNGRASYYSDGDFYLSGPLHHPSSNASSQPLSEMGEMFGLDLFSRVDEDGFVHFGDWGGTLGGFFGCGRGNEFGSAPTNIQTTLSGIDLGQDTDGDGIEDAQDNCPNVSNPSQIDSDSDGIGDSCDSQSAFDVDGDGVANTSDNCPFTNNPGQSDSDSDGIGDACDTTNDSDVDNDGVLNTTDNCPFTANPSQDDDDNDGIGDACDDENGADVDDDGILNTTDNCPFVPNPMQDDDDGDGIGNACDDENGADIDDDGIDNPLDNCPFVANPDQADDDDDGIGNACDGRDDSVATNNDPPPTANTGNTCSGGPPAPMGLAGLFAGLMLVRRRRS